MKRIISVTVILSIFLMLLFGCENTEQTTNGEQTTNNEGTPVLGQVEYESDDELVSPQQSDDESQGAEIVEDRVSPADELVDDVGISDYEPVEKNPIKEEPKVIGINDKITDQYEGYGEGGIGTVVEDTEHSGSDESVPDEEIEIMLLLNKTMSISELDITTGTTVYWKNYDTYPHVISVLSGSGWDTINHGKSGRLLEGNVWSFTFTEPGEYFCRDAFSGKMHVSVTVT